MWDISTKDEFVEQVRTFSKRPPHEGEPVLVLVLADECPMSAYLEQRLEDEVRSHPQPLRLARLSVDLVEEMAGREEGEVAIGMPPQTFAVYGGSFVPGFHGVPDDDQLSALVQQVADLQPGPSEEA